MKILISAKHFDSTFGGMETVTRLLATEFVRLGHEVKLVTGSRGAGGPRYPFEVIRRPAPHQLIMLVRWSEVYFQVHISLLLAWPLVVIRKPWVVSQHTWLASDGESGAWRGKVKRYLLRFATTVAISHAIAGDIPIPTQIIGNPYDDATFRLMPDVKRENELVFVGRLVFGKGAHLILEALATLKSRGRTYRLTVVGQGPEEEALRRQARELDLDAQVTFVGLKTGIQLANILNAHQILVVPSLWEEPFGVVALEGCACGCVVVGSDKGGLPEAIGPSGVTVPSGDAQVLADSIDRLVSDPALMARFRSATQAHLTKHSSPASAMAYLRVFESALSKAKR